MRSIPVIVFLLLFFTNVFAAGGALVKKGTQEALEIVSRLLSDDVAEKVARTRVESAIDVLRKAYPDQKGKFLKLHGTYKDDSYHVIKKPDGVALFLKYGDEAAAAIVKHKDLAINSLKKVALFGDDAVSLGSQAVQKCSKEGTRNIAIALNRGTINKGNAASIFRFIKKKGDSAAKFVKTYPKTTIIAAGIATLVIANPPIAKLFTPETIMEIAQFIAEYWIWICSGIAIVLALILWRYYRWVFMLAKTVFLFIRNTFRVIFLKKTN